MSKGGCRVFLEAGKGGRGMQSSEVNWGTLVEKGLSTATLGNCRHRNWEVKKQKNPESVTTP
jgi:hypothetical protein